jgi:hypothetical protein
MEAVMQDKPQFGTIKAKKLLDEEGSKVTVEEKLVNGQVNRPVRKYFEIKTRVRDQKEEHATYIAFSDSIRNDNSKLDPDFRIEKSALGNEKGFYYVVSCYTQLEY